MSDPSFHEESRGFLQNLSLPFQIGHPCFQLPHALRVRANLVNRARGRRFLRAPKRWPKRCFFYPTGSSTGWTMRPGTPDQGRSQAIPYHAAKISLLKIPGPASRDQFSRVTDQMGFGEKSRNRWPAFVVIARRDHMKNSTPKFQSPLNDLYDQLTIFGCWIYAFSRIKCCYCQCFSKKE